MIYLIWSLLNIGLFIFFIAICFKGIKLIREKIGMVAAIVFVLGLLSFMGGSDSDNKGTNPQSNQIRTWQFFSQDSLDKNSIAFLQIDLEKTSISKYWLGVQYGKDRLQNTIPIGANSWTTGFQSGTNWEPSSIIVNRTDEDGKFGYRIIGTIKWKILGMTIYNQEKQWNGFARVK